MKTQPTILDLVPEIGETSVLEERSPHIVKNLLDFWGTSFFMEYVDLIINYMPTKDRPARQGFPFDSLMELQKIVDKHNDKFPHYKTRIDIWI